MFLDRVNHDCKRNLAPVIVKFREIIRVWQNAREIIF